MKRCLGVKWYSGLMEFIVTLKHVILDGNNSDTYQSLRNLTGRRMI